MIVTSPHICSKEAQINFIVTRRRGAGGNEGARDTGVGSAAVVVAAFSILLRTAEAPESDPGPIDFKHSLSAGILLAVAPGAYLVCWETEILHIFQHWVWE